MLFREVTKGKFGISQEFLKFYTFGKFLNIAICTKPFNVVVAFQTFLAMVHKWNECIHGNNPKGSSKMCHLQGNDWHCFWHLNVITFLCVWFFNISQAAQINLIYHSVYTVNFSWKWIYNWLNYNYGVCTSNCYQQRDHLTVFDFVKQLSSLETRTLFRNECLLLETDLTPSRFCGSESFGGKQRPLFFRAEGVILAIFSWMMKRNVTELVCELFQYLLSISPLHVCMQEVIQLQVRWQSFGLCNL